MNVVICEKGVVGGEQSGRAYSQIISYKTSPEIFPLHHYGKILWTGMNEKSVLIQVTAFKAVLKFLLAKKI